MKMLSFLHSSESFPLQNIFCIGRNYVEHAKELNNPIPKEPVVFLKPNSSVISDGDTVLIPTDLTQDVHHEVEVVIVLGEGGKNISRAQALRHIAGVGIGLDLTARDLQQIAKEKGLPWTMAKGLDTFAPISRLVPLEAIGNLDDLHFTLQVNGEPRQAGCTRDMIFSVADLIAFLSTRFRLSRGDVIFTGTPQGVGPVRPGDDLHAILGDNFVDLRVRITSQS